MIDMKTLTSKTPVFTLDSFLTGEVALQNDKVEVRVQQPVENEPVFEVIASNRANGETITYDTIYGEQRALHLLMKTAIEHKAKFVYEMSEWFD